MNETRCNAYNDKYCCNIHAVQEDAMTVRTQRRSRTMSSTTVATSRRPLMMRARHLALLVEFAYAELTATATERWARELPAVQWSSFAEMLPTGPTPRDVTPAALRALQRTLATKLDALVPTSGNPEQSLLVQEVGAHRVVLLVRGRQVERTALSEWPNTFWIAVLAILETGGHRLARCLRPECCRVFVRMRRQQYCSPRCSQIMRSRRWYAAHRPEAQRRRREAYQAQVKTVYPRAKVATRTRRARRQ